MSNDNIVTFYGHVGTRVELREGANVPWSMFRAASTPSHWDAATRTWIEDPTTWVTVKSFRALAQNAAESLTVGDPIVVIGRLRTDVWESKEGEKREAQTIMAAVIAHDLNRGTTRFVRLDRKPAVQNDQGVDLEVMESLVQESSSTTAA